MRSFARFWLATFSVAILLALATAKADELIMKNGDRLTGKVGRKTDGLLEFRTPYAGTIKVKWDRIASIRTDEAVTLMLKDETVVEGLMTMDGDGTIVLSAEREDRVQEIDPETIAFVNPEPWRTGTGVKFTGRLNLAFERERGNTDTDELDIDGEATLRRKQDRFKAFGEFEQDKSNNSRTAKNWLATGKYDYFTDTKRYYSFNLFFENDDFADLDLRASLGPALGYQFFESKGLNLAIEGGINYVSEDFKTDDDNQYAAARWMVNYDQFFFNELFQLYHLNIGLWSLEASDDYVIKSRTGIRVPLLAGFVASAELKADWDNAAAANTDELDTTFLLKLGYEW